MCSYRPEVRTVEWNGRPNVPKSSKPTGPKNEKFKGNADNSTLKALSLLVLFVAGFLFGYFSNSIDAWLNL